VPTPTLPIARAAASACPDVNLQPTPATAARAARSTLCLINLLRTSRGLRRVKTDRRLARVGRRHSRAMIAQRFFAHVDPAGRDVAGRLGADGWLPRPPYWLVGENLAFGEGPVSTPIMTVQGWYFSTSHRENMLDPQFDRAGIGVVVGAPVDLPPGPPARRTRTCSPLCAEHISVCQGTDVVSLRGRRVPSVAP
jgi:uncharacterized protein YkwD